MAGVGVFAEGADRTFSLTPLGTLLRDGVPGSLRSFVQLQGHPLIWQGFGQMLQAVRTGRPSTEQTLGMPLLAYLGQHQQEAALFGRAMVGIHGTEVAAVTAAYDFAGVRQVLDVGGGFGNLLAAILQGHPTLTGVLFDQPHTAVQATRLLAAAGVSDRCTVVSGDFFQRVPEGGDPYLLSHVVHDWDTARCQTLGRNCRQAMAPDGRLLIVEMVIPPPNQPSPARMFDLVMLTLVGGQERTADEYRDLLQQAGFTLTRILPTASPVSVIEGRPA